MRFFHKLTKVEKIMLLFFIWVLFFSSLKIVIIFLDTQWERKAANWWLFSEWAVWEISLINPLFDNLNPIDRDISWFIFRWLMRYESWSIVDDIATHTLSFDKKTYTFTLKPWIKWHDWALLTIDDIYYTYHDILQSPDFENTSLSEGLKNVKIEKISGNQITFVLEKPYKFFLSNLIIWIVPKHILESVPIRNLALSEFNYDSPVWLWPYKFQSFKKTLNWSKIVLERFESFYWKKPYIDQVEFSLYKSKNTLISDIWSLSAVKPSQNKIELSKAREYQFSLNRYVWVFFNTESNILKNKDVRLALNLSTNRSALLEGLEEDNIINTSILDLKSDSWIYEYDKIKAQWALHETGWKKAEKIEIDENNWKESKSYITSHENWIFATDKKAFFIKWTVPLKTSNVYINNYNLKMYVSWTTKFSFYASTVLWNLKLWENDFELKVKYYSWDEEVLENLKVFVIKDKDELDAKQKEIASLIKRKEIEKLKEKQDLEKKLKSIKQSEFRINEKWDILSIKLITDENIFKYKAIAEKLKQQWKEVWVDLTISFLKTEDLQTAIKNKNYDILLYWQVLWYNLDTYSYWHSSQAENGWNFSNLKSNQVDILIENMRASHDEEEREKNLKLLSKEFERLVPAIFLYSPIYYYSIDSTVKWVSINDLPNLNDRFSWFNNWHINEKKDYWENAIKEFFKWLYVEIKN